MSQGHEKEADLLLYSAANHIAAKSALITFYRLALCRSIGRIVEVHEAVSNQHHISNDVSTRELRKKVDDALDYYMRDAGVLRVLDTLRIDGLARRGLPEVLLGPNKQYDETHERFFRELEKFVVLKTLPTLEKYEPDFAAHIHRSIRGKAWAPLASGKSDSLREEAT